MANLRCRYFSIIILAFALFSCGNSGYDRRLLEIEKVIPQQADLEPDMADSAYSMIQAYAPARECSEADSALLTLLKAEADYKMYISNTDTAGLRKSADFFRRTGDKRRLMRADFQIIATCVPMDEIEYGFVPALEGLDIAQSLNDSEYLGRFNTELGDSYLRRWSRKEALRHNILASDYYKKTEMWPNFRYAKLAEGIIYLNLWEHEQARAVLDSLISIIPEPDSAMLYYAYNYRMIADYYLGHFQDARDSKRHAELFEVPGCEHTQRFTVAIALINGDEAEARRILKQWEDTVHKGEYDEIQYLYTRYMYEKWTNNNEAALRYHEQYRDLSDSYSIEYLNGGLNLMRAQYEAEKERKTALKAQRERRIWSAGIVLAILTAAGLGVWLVLTIRRRRRELEEKMALIAELSEEVESKDGLLRQSLYAQFRRINDLSVLYLKLPKKEKSERAEILAHAREALAQIGTRENLEEYVREFDLAHQGLATHIREALPKLKARDLYILVLSLWGLQPKVVSAICGISLGACYTARTRLRQRLMECDDPRLQEAAATLNNDEDAE
ncbi:MAG: hypothetical protein K2L96_07960 [Muribaculaceae bacterium]|nr:hypothetical protein [Muribaculaceae bacterium]